MAKTTIQAAQASYEDMIPTMKKNYTAGMNAFFGQDVSNSAPVRKYQRNVTPGKGADWAAGMRARFGV